MDELKNVTSGQAPYQKPYHTYQAPYQAYKAPYQPGSPGPNAPSASSTPPGDISRRTIIVLLILVTILSAVGTISVFNEMAKFNAAPTMTQKNVGTAQVQFRILDEKPPRDSYGTGKVIFTIKDEKIKN